MLLRFYIAPHQLSWSVQSVLYIYTISIIIMHCITIVNCCANGVTASIPMHVRALTRTLRTRKQASIQTCAPSGSLIRIMKSGQRSKQGQIYTARYYTAEPNRRKQPAQTLLIKRGHTSSQYVCAPSMHRCCRLAMHVQGGWTEVRWRPRRISAVMRTTDVSRKDEAKDRQQSPTSSACTAEFTRCSKHLPPHAVVNIEAETHVRAAANDTQ